jgi:hypothetical protein
MKMDTIESEIIGDWESLPETERRTINHASWFADKNEGRYPFSNDARPYRIILELIADYQIHIGKPLKFR